MDISTFFQTLAEDIGSDIKDYSKSSLEKFVETAKQEIGGLSGYYVLSQKGVSLLHNNLPYIIQTVKTTKGLNDESIIKGQKVFNFIDKDGNEVKYDGTPLLVDPSNDIGGQSNGRDKDVIILDNKLQHKVDAPQAGGETAKLNKGNEDNLIYKLYEQTQEDNEQAQWKRKVLASDGQLQSDKGLFYKELKNNGVPGEIQEETIRNYDGTILKPGAGEQYKDTSLFNKTAKLFEKKDRGCLPEAEMGTLISRFYRKASPTTESSSVTNDRISHGRNLLRKKETTINGYVDPYCRVWTWHHQYGRYISDTIRPMLGENDEPIKYDELYDRYNWDQFRPKTQNNVVRGGERLEKYGSMYDNKGLTNGLVNITPIRELGAKDYNVSIEHCMFSIENLAWKGLGNIESNGYKKGPLGGRIMWFPPYDLSFSEQSSAHWDENTFIGRGEPIYTYANTSRSGTLHFKLLIDHPMILNYWEDRDKPQNVKVDNDGNQVIDIENDPEQKLLRFFAGCEILKSRKAPQEVVKEEDDDDDFLADVPRGSIIIPVFFPNNYSGVDDWGNNEVDPIKYLLNGLGSQKFIDSNVMVRDMPTSISSGWELEALAGEGGDADTYGASIGGYELREDYGISVTKFPATNGSNGNSKKITILSAKKTGDKNERYIFVRQKGTPKTKNEGWAYRVDKAYADQFLVHAKTMEFRIESYFDTVSYQLNSQGCYTYGRQLLGDRFDDLVLFSLADAYAAQHDEFRTMIGEDSGIIDAKQVNQFEKMVNGRKINKIRCVGCASNPGRGGDNDNLSRNRAKTVEKWLKSEFKQLNESVIDSDYVSLEKPNKVIYSKEGEEALTEKLGRRAFAIISFQEDETVKVANTLLTSEDNSTLSPSSTNNENAKKAYEMATYADKLVKEKTIINEGGVADEALFFRQLKKNDPFIHSKLCERIKFFNPAFHSMTPEGFNARLTFLNQCMRQGPTVSGSDTNGENANNLAFGRPPVCVLRIGDFYNTKIVVTSLTINYDPLTWDLNQEGIGVMPMIADITMSFNFVGGSELGGPVQRLQNAISENYYANSSVWSKNPDIIEYGDGGNIKSFNIGIVP